MVGGELVGGLVAVGELVGGEVDLFGDVVKPDPLPVAFDVGGDPADVDFFCLAPPDVDVVEGDVVGGLVAGNVEGGDDSS